MKYILITVLFCIAIVSHGNAQYLSSQDSDPEAVRLLTQAGQHFSGKNAEVKFKLKITIPERESMISEGLLYQGGKSYHLDLKDYAIISNGTTRWVYLKGPNEVNIYNESNGQDWISPQDFLHLHTAKDLVFIFTGTRADGVSIIEAKPLKGRFEEYSKFTIGIKNGSLHFVHVFSSDGVRQEMTIASVTHPASWDAQKLFTFRPEQYPGVHVEDLRLD